MKSHKPLNTHLRPLTAAVRVVGLAGALLSSGVSALGLGDLKLYSAVNEPLRAEIRLLKVGNLDPNQVLVKLASRQDFERASVERGFFLTGMDYEVVLDGRGGGIVKVSTDDPVREPYLNFLLEAKWPSGRLVREYTLLMDLPAFSSTNSAGSSALQAPSTSTASSSTSARSSQPAPARPAPTGQPPVIASATPLNTQRTSGRVVAAPTPSFQGDGYTVQRGDTLWEIAARVKPGSGVSVNQTMLALQRENPSAFINDNINLLKSGHVLRVPDQNRVLDIANNQAQLEVARQMREWRSRDGQSGRQIDARSQASEQAPAAGSADNGTLSLSNADGSGIAANATTDANVQALQGRLNGVLDQLSNSNSENEQLNERVQTLLSELETMKNKLELRNSQMAQLQAQGVVEATDLEFDSVAATPEELPVDEAEFSSEFDAAGSEMTDQQQGLVDDFEATEYAGPEEEFAAETDLIEEEFVEPEVKPAPVVINKPESFLDKLLSPTWLGGIAGILALIAAVFYWRRRKADEEEFDITEDSEFDDAPTMMAEDEAEVVAQEEDSVDTQQARPQHTSADGIEAEMGDPVAEADIYVAYGRYPQAIELLNRALEQDPDNPELIAKLAEVYSAAGDEDSAETERAKLGGAGMAAAAVAGVAGIGAVAGAAIAGATDELGDAGADAANELGDFGSDIGDDLNLGDDIGNFDEAPDVVQEFKETLPDGAMDFDQDDSSNALEDALQDVGSADEGFDLGDDLNLDDDLDLGDMDLDAADTQESATVAADELDIAGDVGLTEPDIDLSLDEDLLGDVADDSAADDFDLGLDLDSADEAVEQNDIDPSELREAFAGGNDLADRNFVDETAEPLLGADDVEPSDEGSKGMLGGAIAGVGGVAAAVGAAKSGIGEQLMDLISDDDSSEGDLLQSASTDIDIDLDMDSELSELDASLADDDLLGDMGLDISEPEVSADAAEESFSITSDTSNDFSADISDDISDDLAADFSEDFAGLSDADGDQAGDDDLEVMDADETATKLDLARAFIEVGDADGARDILDEVIEEGSAEDQQQAKELLERIV